jgi:[acyl-carrier-protein] S-malonyltransferase
VISGHKTAVERAMKIAAEKGGRRSIMLPVSAPFHCQLMAPAAREMEEALAEISLAPPSVPLLANVTAAPVSDPETIRRLLVEQVTGMVRWRESVLRLKAEGATRLIELGAGKVLAGLAKRIDKDLDAVSVGLPADVDPILKSL